MDKSLSDQLDKKSNGADEVEHNGKKYIRTGPKNSTSNPGPWREVKESTILKDLMMNETIGEGPALAAYQDQVDAANKNLELLLKRMKEHDKDAHKKPNLHSVGQMIKLNKHLGEAFKALNTI
jgi:hypothetical protein